MDQPHPSTRPAFLPTLLLVVAALGFASLSGAQTETEIQALFKQHAFKNDIVKPASGILKHPYLVPSGPYFQLFDWDTYFMGVALSYDGVGKPLASSVEDFLEFVDQNANVPGYTPREIAPDGFWALPEMCKPFLAQAALRASKTTGDYQWIAPYYKRLGETISFWERTRESPDGLFRWYNGVESGTDNNTAVIDHPAVTTEGVDLACYIFREYKAMAIIAEKLGKPHDAAEYRAKAEALAQRIRTTMWSGRDGLFFNIDSRTGRFIRVKAWTDFVPLWAGVASKPQAVRMIREHLLNPAEFWAPYGVRTLARDEPLYDPAHGYWRGPVWVISNYLMMHGLMNYGYHAQAIDLAQKTVRLLVEDIKKTGGMNECYNPETGVPVAAGHFVSWNLLAEHMIQEASSGSDPTSLH